MNLNNLTIKTRLIVVIAFLSVLLVGIGCRAGLHCAVGVNC